MEDLLSILVMLMDIRELNTNRAFTYLYQLWTLIHIKENSFPSHANDYKMYECHIEWHDMNIHVM